MKKLLCILLLLLILSLTACQKEPPTVQDSFDLAFTVTQDETDYAGTLNLGDGTMKITMTAPYTIEGTAFTYENGELTIGCGSLGTKANCDYLPAESIPTSLYDALTYLAQAVYTESQDGSDSFSLPTPYGDAVLTAENGLPTSLQIPQSDLFFHFQPLSEKGSS